MIRWQRDEQNLESDSNVVALDASRVKQIEFDEPES
jgi:hypothetical protein